MALSRNKGSRDDVNSKVYNTREFTITTGQELEAFTDATTKESRQWIYVKNLGPGRISVGPQGAAKDTLFRNQGKYWNHSDDLEVYVELVTGASATVFVEESG